MTLLKRVALSSLAFAVLTGCPGPTRECEFNSNCPIGRYCSAEGSCRADCTATAGCSAGQSCNSFGMCIGATDAGPMDDAFTSLDDASIDAARVRTDAFTPADAGPDATLDAGPPPERCTPSTLGAVPEDENRDGQIDEGCDWYFGTGQFVSQLELATARQYTPTLTPDGLRIYFTGASSDVHSVPSAPDQLVMATRSSLTSTFGAPVRIALPANITSISRASVRFDELEVIIGGGARLWRATRASTSEPFGGAVELPFMAYDPHLSADGLELFFTRGVGTVGFTLHRSRRASLADTFTDGVPLDLGGVTGRQTVGPSLSPDGLTLFFAQYSTASRYRARRASTSTTTFGVPVEMTDLPGYMPTFSRVSREVFFGIGTNMWDGGLGRAQVCRDAACTNTPISCNTLSGERLSPDGLHCYWRPAAPAAPATWETANGTCVTTGTVGDVVGHLATIHSVGEEAVVTALIGSSDRAWIGMTDAGRTMNDFAWVTGEPFTYLSWRAGEPGAGPGENCGVQRGMGLIGWNDRDCAVSDPYICERERWPNW